MSEMNLEPIGGENAPAAEDDTIESPLYPSSEESNPRDVSEEENDADDEDSVDGLEMPAANRLRSNSSTRDRQRGRTSREDSMAQCNVS